MLNIAITDCSRYENYINWLRTFDPYITDIRLSYASDNLSRLRKCGGLVLTGGGDVDPDLYDPDLPPDKRILCQGIDRRRDDFEWKAIDQAIKSRMPILGICRGCQISNVYFGGTLISDLGEKNKVHRKEKGIDKRHSIEIVADSFLYTITRRRQGEVNSSHHQAVKKIGERLMISARSKDGVMEALEYKAKSGQEFMLLVQWHPERMTDQDNPLCKNIALSFLSSIKGS